MECPDNIRAIRDIANLVKDRMIIRTQYIEEVSKMNDELNSK